MATRARVYDPFSPFVADVEAELGVTVVEGADGLVTVQSSPKAATVYAWDDGTSNTTSPSTGKSTHTYAYNGEYTITATQGAKSATQTVVIESPVTVSPRYEYEDWFDSALQELESTE